MPTSAIAFQRRFAPAFSRAPALLASTCVTALLLGAPAQAGQTVTNMTVATVNNPAGNNTTSIVINGSKVTGAVTNAGTITPGKANGGATGAINLLGSTIGAGIANSGTITTNAVGNLGGGIVVLGSTISANGISNTNTINVTGVSLSAGFSLAGSNVTGGLSNSAAINVTGANSATGIGVNHTNLSGGISNAGTIHVSSGGTTIGIQVDVSVQTTVSGGVANSGTLNLSGMRVGGIVIADANLTSGAVSNTNAINAAGVKTGVGIALNNSGTVAGGVSNAGAIMASGSVNAAGIVVSGGSFVTSNGIVNTSAGTITLAGGVTGVGIVVNASSVAGGISNAGAIKSTGGSTAFGIETVGGTVTGGITNSGTITLSGAKTQAVGIDINIDTQVGVPSTVSGGVTNTGTITVSGAGQAAGIAVNAGLISDTGITNKGTITVSASNNAAGIGLNAATVAGGVLNAGAIAVSSSGSGNAAGIAVNTSLVTSGGITNAATGTITAAGGNTGVGIVAMTSSVTGAITNAGTIKATGQSTAFGIEVVDSPVSGGIANSGTIAATAGTLGVGIAVSGNSPISGGITNTGNVTGSSAAISLAGEAAGVSNTVTQAGGTIAGNIIGSGIKNGDVLNVTGGTIVLQPTQSISGFGTYNQSGGTLAFNVTASTTPGTYPTLNAGTINLKGGTFELLPAAGSIATLASQHTTVFKNVVVADPPLSGSFANVTSGNFFFTASLSPDATTANALDATLTLSTAALAASAQDLTQDGRLGLDAPRVLTEAIQDRLVANGGALGEWVPGGPAPGGVISKGPITQPSYSFGNANIWARGYDQFGTATAQASTAGVGYNINRAAPIIAGIDWRLDNNFVAGVAATYVLTSASFKDGSKTDVNSYQGGAYVGWAGGPFYALGSVVASFNDYSTTRLLSPFGLPGEATSSPSGQSYQGHAEAGYHWLLPAAGMNLNVTPYAALDYVNAHADGFSETGGFGAFAVNSTDNNSFQTTLGVRLTSRIATANGWFTPELRLGWSHEFLDASQKITASLVGVPSSSFTSTGILFGRDAALIGAGFSFEITPQAKVFVDYDGRLGSRLQEHSISGGVKVRF